MISFLAYARQAGRVLLEDGAYAVSCATTTSLTVPRRAMLHDICCWPPARERYARDPDEMQVLAREPGCCRMCESLRLRSLMDSVMRRNSVQMMLALFDV